MKISEISIEKITGTANSTMFTFIVEGNTKFQLKVSKNKDVIFFLSKFVDSLNSIHGPFCLEFLPTGKSGSKHRAHLFGFYSPLIPGLVVLHLTWWLSDDFR